MTQLLQAAPNNQYPLVSVVIPTYNRSSLLLHAMESVLQQTYSPLEIIVIDDGSTDDTRVRLGPYLKRIRYFYQPNQGVSAALNAGIREAQGEWISILASDDLWDSRKIEMQIEAVRMFGQECGACFTNCFYSVDGKLGNDVFGDVGLTRNELFGQLHNPISYILGPRFGIYVQSLMVSRSLMEEAGGFDETLGLGEDRDLIFRLSLKTKFCFVSAPLTSIDRTPAVPRLTALHVGRTDQQYSWDERGLKKMLDQAAFLDDETAKRIQCDLVGLYYDWLAAKMKQFKIRGAVELIFKLRRQGQAYSDIIRVTLSRAYAKALRRTFA